LALADADIPPLAAVTVNRYSPCGVRRLVVIASEYTEPLSMEILSVECGGIPVIEKLTPAAPLGAVTVIVYLAVPPGGMTTNEGEIEMEKSELVALRKSGSGCPNDSWAIAATMMSARRFLRP
jgi:hypothetical protein